MAKESCNLIGAPCCKTEITFLYVDFSTKMEVVLTPRDRIENG